MKTARGAIDLRRGSEGAAVAAIEEVVGEELNRPVRWGSCRVVDPEVVGAPSGDAPRKRTGLETRTDANSKGRERKVIRAPGRGCGYGCGYGRPAPQGMPLSGNAPWGTPGHAANRHCPLGPAPAPVTSYEARVDGRVGSS
jgi:hypothetical protein